MPTKFSANNGYTNADYTARAITGSNNGFTDTDKVSDEQLEAYNESFRGRVNKSYGTGNMRVMSRVNADRFAKFASDSDGYRIVSRYDTIMFIRRDMLTGETIQRIGYAASQSVEFTDQILVWLTEEVIWAETRYNRRGSMTTINEGHFSYYAYRSENGKMTPVKHKEHKPKVYRRNRRVY